MPVRDTKKPLCFSYDDIPLPVIVHQPHDGVIVNFNQAAKKKLGLSQESKGLKIKSIRPETPTAKPVEKEGFLDYGKVVHLTSKGAELSLNILRKKIQIDGKEFFADFLEESKDDFKTNIMSGSVDAIISTDLKGNIIEWNPAAEKLFGWKRKEVIGKNIVTLTIPERFRKSFLQKMKLLQKSKQDKNSINQLMELNGIRKDGQEFSADLSITSMDVRGKNIIFCRLRDISDRKRIEEDLKQSELSLKRAQEVASIGSWEMSGRFQDVYWSDEFYRIHGLKPQSVKPSTRLRLTMVFPADRSLLEEAIESAFKDGKPYSIEKRIVLPNKEIRWVLSQGEASLDPITGNRKVFGTLLDITDRKNFEEEQIRIKRNLQQTLRFSRMGTAELTISTGIVSVDEQLFELLEEKDSKPRSMPIHAFVKKYVVKEDIDFILENIKEGSKAALISENDLLIEFRMRTAKGRILHIDAQGTFRNDGTALGIFRDVSLRRKAEADSKSKGIVIENMLNGITDGFFATDRELNFTMANPVFASLAHLKPDEVIGKNIFKLFPIVKDNELSASYSKALKTGKSIATEFRDPSNPDQVFQVNIYPNKEGLFVYYKDISEAKKIENEIIISRNTLSNLIENLPGYVYRIDYGKTKTPIFISNQFEEITGYSVEEYLEKHVITFRQEVHKDDLQRLKNCVDEALKVKESYSCEYRITTKQKTEKWLLEKGKGIFTNDGKLQYLEGFVIDVTDRKKSEQLAVQLKENDELLSNIIKNIPRGVVYQYTVNARGKIDSFPFVSEGSVELFNLTPQYIKSNPACLYDLVMPEDLIPLKAQSDLAIKQNSLFEHEYRIVSANGVVKWMHTRAFPKKQTNGVTIWDAITLDITEQKELEQDIREREERFRSLVRDINIGVLLQGPRSEIFLSNQAGLDLLGLTEDQLLGKTAFDKSWVMKREDGTEFPGNERPVMQAIKTKKPVRDVIMGLYRANKKDNIWLSVDALPRLDEKGEIINVICTFRDITESKKQQEELFQSKKYFESLVNSQSSYIIRTDMTGKYTFVNEKFNEVFNYYNKSMIGMDSMDTIIPADHELCFKTVLECFDNPGKVFPVRLRKPKKNNKGYYWTEWEFVALQNEKGELNGIQAVGLDASDRILSQLELQKTTSRFLMAKQAAKLGIWEWDMLTGELIWDDITYEMMGFPQGKKMTIELLSEIINPDDLQLLYKSISELTPQNNSMSHVMRLIRPSDKQQRYIRFYTIVEFDIDGNTSKMTGVNYDTTEQEIAIESIRESEKRFRSMADSAPVLIWMAGTDKRCSYINKGWMDFTGRTAEQELGSVWTESIHPDDYPACDLAFSACFDERITFSMEYRLRRADGQYRWIMDTGNPRFLENGEFVGYIGTCFDIHERKIAEDMLKESELRFRTMADSAPVFIWLADEDKEHNYFNKVYLDFTGRSLEEEIDSHWMNQIHPQDVIKYKEAMDAAYLTQTSYTIEYRLRNKNYDYRWVLAKATPRYVSDGTFIGFIGSGIDITERKEAEEKLIKSERRFNTFMKHTPFLNWITDTNGKVSYLNEAYYELIDKTPEPLGKSVFELFPENVAFQFMETAQSSTDTGEVLQTVEIIPKRDQSIGEFLLYQFPMGDNLIGGVAADITKQRQAERKLVESLAEKDLLIKEIHHRVKNNLQLISSILYIKMAGMQQSEIRSFLEDTRQKIRSIALIHERLLQTGSVNEVDIADYLGKLINDLQLSNKRQDIVIHFETKIEPEKINLDTAIYCGLIINELITNSMKHAFVNREVGIIQVYFSREGDKHRLIISDNGSSLPENIKPGHGGSFGMQMLDIFIKQLSGVMEIKRNNGTEFNILFGNAQ